MKTNASAGWRAGWAVAVLLLGLAAVHRGWRGWEIRHGLEQEGRALAARCEALEEQRREAAARVEALRLDAEAARREASLAAARLADANAAAFEARSRSERARADLAPPEHRPFWNPASEFVWISKSALARWPIQAVQEDGALSVDATSALGLPHDRAQRLNERLRGLLAEFYAQDLGNARVVVEHLPGIAEKEGAKLTVRIDFDLERVRSMRARFQMTLREELGEQRSGIVHAWAEEWLAEQLPLVAEGPRVISVVRHPDRSYTIRLRVGEQNGFMFSGPMRLEDYVPPHLHSLFDPLTRE